MKKKKKLYWMGNTITNSEYRVAIAQIKDGSDTEDKWVEFNEAFTYFEGKVYDYQKNIKWLLFAHQVKLETHLKVRLIVHYLLTN